MKITIRSSKRNEQEERGIGYRGPIEKVKIFHNNNRFSMVPSDNRDDEHRVSSQLMDRHSSKRFHQLSRYMKIQNQREENEKELLIESM